MKIEMGESLLYSWLRHVKECQIVQTNWKGSNQWELKHEEEIEELSKRIDEHFNNNYGYVIYKKSSSLSQVIRQTECDVLGINLCADRNEFYGIEVAFHENGLNYGIREETVEKVISKMVRIALCIYGYMDSKDANIIFASPKINEKTLNDIILGINDLNNLFRLYGYEFCFRVVANEQFDETIMQPILIASNGVADTSELFIRSYQMFKMFDNTPHKEKKNYSNKTVENKVVGKETHKELKVGQLARFVLGPMLEKGMANELEIKWMQEAEYCKETFGLQYPLLIKTNADKKESRYYATPLYINGERYRMCSEWFETEANDDRTLLEKWIKEHSKEGGKTLVKGYTNRNNQENYGCLNKPGNHYNQTAYLLHCNECGFEYEANGCDVAIRKCPRCM